MSPRRRPTTTLTHLLAASLAVGATLGAGCGPAEPPLPPEPARCTAPTSRDVDAGPVLDGMAPRTATLGTGDGASFTPWSDGAAATVVMGFQGGAMLTPTLRVPALPTEGDTICLRVELQNSLTDASEVLPGGITEVTFVRVGEDFEAAYVYDQLGFDAASLRGKTLVLVATVTGVTFTTTTTLHLALR